MKKDTKEFDTLVLKYKMLKVFLIIHWCMLPLVVLELFFPEFFYEGLVKIFLWYGIYYLYSEMWIPKIMEMMQVELMKEDTVEVCAVEEGNVKKLYPTTEDINPEVSACKCSGENSKKECKDESQD